MARPRGWFLNRKPFERELVRSRISRADLARISGVSPQMIASLTAPANRRSGASPRIAAALAGALECDVETLFPEAAGFGAPARAA